MPADPRSIVEPLNCLRLIGAGRAISRGMSSSLHALYSFSVELSHISAGIYERVSFRTAFHAQESIENVLCRALAYLHSYRPELMVNPEDFPFAVPTLIAKDPAGRELSFIQIGTVVPRAVCNSLKHSPRSLHRLYWFDESHQTSFVKELTPKMFVQLSELEIFQVPTAPLAILAEGIEPRSEWSVTVDGEGLFVSTKRTEVNVELERVTLQGVRETCSLASKVPV